MRRIVTAGALLLTISLIAVLFPIEASSHSPYAGTWELKFTVTQVAAEGQCYDTTALNQEQSVGTFTVDGDGKFTIMAENGETALTGSILSNGSVAYSSPPEFSGCKVVASGTCASTSSCSGTMTLRNDRAAWRFVRANAPSSGTTTGSSAPPNPYAGNWYLYWAVTRGGGGCTNSALNGQPEQFIGEFTVGTDGSFAMPSSFGATGGTGRISDSGAVSYQISLQCGSGPASGGCETRTDCKGTWTINTNSPDTGTFHFVRKQATAEPTPPPPSGNSAPYAKFTTSFEGRAACVDEKLSFYDVSYDPDQGDYVASRSWRVNGEVSPSSDTTISWTFNFVGGPVGVELTVKDRTGASQMARREFQIVGCSSGTPTATAATPTRTYTSEPCAEIRTRWDAELSAAKYDYYKFYDSEGKDPGSDAEFEARFGARLQGINDRFNQEWQAAGCAGQTETGDCKVRFEAAAGELDGFRRKFGAIWAQYQADLESARKEFWATGYRTEAEAQEFQTQWDARSAAILSQMKSDGNIVAERYRLYECGFYLEQYGAPTTNTYGETPPVPDDYRRICEGKIGEAKAEFEQISRSHYENLRKAEPGSAAYEAERRELDRLEGELRSRIQEILSSCHTLVKDQYDAPTTYGEGIGSLTCYSTEEGTVVCSGKYIKFVGNQQTQALSDYSCGGQFWFQQMFSNEFYESFGFSTEGDGSVVRIGGERLKLLLHDGPRGVVNVNTAGETVLSIVPAAYVEVTSSGDGSQVILSSAGQRGAWLSDNRALTWDAAKRLLTIAGAATWVAETCAPDGSAAERDNPDEYNEAIFARKLGAQVVIRLQGDSVEDDQETYDEGMKVQVRRERANKYEATIDSEGGTCKTVVLKFDSSIFSTVQLKVTIVDENGREVASSEAMDLEDVLDPCNDGANAFEHWIVVDRHGTQVIVSFSHFSEKRVSVEAAAVTNIGIPGLGLPAIGVVLAAAVAVVPRGRRPRS